MGIWKGNKNMNNPKFSIIIGMFNQLDNLPKLIESFNNQLFKDFEVIFCDDGSNDGTKEFFLAEPEFEFEYRYIRQRNKGNRSAKNINNGIKKAQGKYCVFIMGDSFPELNYLEILNEHVDEEIIVCGIRIQIDGKRAVDVDWRIAKGKIPQHDAIIINEPFNALTGNGLTIPTEAMRKYGMWDTKVKDYGGEDNLILMNLYFKGYICKSVPQLVLYHNWHKGKSTSSKNFKYLDKKFKEYAYGN